MNAPRRLRAYSRRVMSGPARRRALAARLDDLVRDAACPPAALRPRALALLRAELTDGRNELRRRFDDGAPAAETARAHAALIDRTVGAIHDFAARRLYPAANPTVADRLCLDAVGGYGRAELAPHSDVDLLFVLPYKETARLEQVIEYVLYVLWDLDLRVGHATRSVDDCLRLSGDDLTIRTSVLEARYVAGEGALHDELRRRFAAEFDEATGPAFVAGKLAERDARHRRMGDSRYVLEPDVKDGKGGLRDLQTLSWIARYLYRTDDAAGLVARGVLTEGEAARFAKARNFLWKVRCHLHYLAGRGENRLTFDLQPEIGRRLGYRDRAGGRSVERFMKHYYLIAKEVGDLTRIFCAALEAEPRRTRRSGPSGRAPAGFALDRGRLTLAPGRRFADDPASMLRIFRIAQERGLDIHPRALRAVARNLRLVDSVREDPEANRLFLAMLTSPKDPETTLRRLNEAGVFGRFLPDFGRVVAQMQHDMYHVYTVDEHTILAIGILNRIEGGAFADEMPVATEAVHKAQSRRALYFALLLHDIAKGRGGDHSRLGADVARRLGPRVGLSGEETETAAWLVRHHLAMSNAAFRRDVDDPKTVSDFVATVQSLERLRLLAALTAADIRAVGPNVWNAWKAALLRGLYHAAEDLLSGGMAGDAAGGGREARAAAARERARELLTEFGAGEIEAHLSRGPTAYWLAFEPAALADHARLLREAAGGAPPVLIRSRVDHARAVTEMTICARDHPGLFCRIAGAMAMSGADVADARIFTLADGMALDTFRVQDANGRAFDRPDDLAGLSRRIEQAVAGELSPQRAIAERAARHASRRTRVFTVEARVLIDNEASRTHTVIEVNGRDRPGLLYRLTRAFVDLGVQIASARITTYGESAVDVFYVKDAFGLKIAHAARLDRIRAALLEALDDSVGIPAAAE